MTIKESFYGKKFSGTSEEIIEEVESYQKLLDFGIVDEVAKEEYGPIEKIV